MRSDHADSLEEPGVSLSEMGTHWRVWSRGEAWSALRFRKLSLAAGGGQEWKQRGQAEDLSIRQQNGRGSARGGGGVERRGGFCTDFEDRTNRIS